MTRLRQNSSVTKAQTPGKTRRAPARARRADRLPKFVGMNDDAEAALDELVVAIVGTGSVGATVALSLARLQVGKLILIDRGKFKAASLLTQPVGPECLGQPKASHLAERCRAISPTTHVEAWDAPLEDLPWSTLVPAGIVVLAGDNLSLTWETGQRCLQLGLPLIHAAIHGETLTAQCRFFAGTEPDGPCPVCLFGPGEFRLLEEERVWSCEGQSFAAGLPRSTSGGRAVSPTRSLRSACALAGHIATLSLVRWALGLGAPLQNTMTEICAYTWRTFVTPLRRNPACSLPHERWKVCASPAALRQVTPASLLRAAGIRAGGAGPATIAILGHRWVECGLCACLDPKPVHRFVRNGHPACSRCQRCRRPLFAQPFYSHESVPAKLLGPRLHEPLGRLGAAHAAEARVRCAHQTVLFVHPPAGRRRGPHPSTPPQSRSSP